MKNKKLKKSISNIKFHQIGWNNINNYENNRVQLIIFPKNSTSSSFNGCYWQIKKKIYKTRIYKNLQEPRSGLLKLEVYWFRYTLPYLFEQFVYNVCKFQFWKRYVFAGNIVKIVQLHLYRQPLGDPVNHMFELRVKPTGQIWSGHNCVSIYRVSCN